MQICVLGAGSLGSAVGGLLARSGHGVMLVTRNDAHVRAIERSGLRLTGELEYTVHVEAATSCAGLGRVDLVIVLVKSFDTRGAIESASPVIGSATTVPEETNHIKFP